MMNRFLHSGLLLLIVLATGCAAAGKQTVSPAPAPGAGNYLIIEGRSGDFLSLDSLATRLASQDVILFGEVHDDSTTHQIQLDLLEAIALRRREVIVGMEMFDRAAQPALDGYLQGRLSEDDFLEGARAWSNYRTDYRPVVELARNRGWPIIGTNLPQDLASLVAREGLGALDRLPAERRGLAASSNECPRDFYWARFRTEITGEDAADHSSILSDDPALGRMFEAQCIRDEAMAEAIARSLRPGFLLYHLNGSFHSDFHQGIVPRLRRRVPELRISTVSAIPPEDDAEHSLLEDTAVADFIILIDPGPDSLP